MPSLLQKKHPAENHFTTPTSRHSALDFFEPYTEDVYPGWIYCECIQQDRIRSTPAPVCKPVHKTNDQPKRTFWQMLFGDSKCCTCLKKKLECCCGGKKKQKCVHGARDYRNVHFQNTGSKGVSKSRLNKYSCPKKGHYPSSKTICGSHSYANIENLYKRPKLNLCDCQNTEQNMQSNIQETRVEEKVEFGCIQEIYIEPKPPLIRTECTPCFSKLSVPEISKRIRLSSDTTISVRGKKCSSEQVENSCPSNVHVDLTHAKTETQFYNGTEGCPKEDGHGRLESQAEEGQIQQVKSDSLSSENSAHSSDKTLTLEINNDRITVQNNNAPSHPIINHESTVLQDYIDHSCDPKSESFRREILPLLEKRHSSILNTVKDGNLCDRRQNAQTCPEATEMCDNPCQCKCNKGKNTCLEKRVSDIFKKLIIIEEKIESIQEKKQRGISSKDFIIAVGRRESSLSLHFKKPSIKQQENHDDCSISSGETENNKGTVIEIRQMKSPKLSSKKKPLNDSENCENGSIFLERGQSKNSSVPKITIKFPKNSSSVSSNKQKVTRDSYDQNNLSRLEDTNDYSDEGNNNDCKYKRVTWSVVSDDLKSNISLPKDSKCYCYDCMYSRNRLSHADKCSI